MVSTIHSIDQTVSVSRRKILEMYFFTSKLHIQIIAGKRIFKLFNQNHLIEISNLKKTQFFSNQFFCNILWRQGFDISDF